MTSVTSAVIEPKILECEIEPIAGRDVTKRSFAWATALLVAIGLALRLWNIDFGLPAVYHPDENKKVAIIKNILRGEGPNFRIHPLIHPGLMVSITAEACRVAIRMGMPQSAPNIILVGRVLATLFSVATIAVTALLGAALFSRRAGLMAGAIVTFSPVLVAHSRYLKEDAFLTLFIMASLLGATWWTTAESASRRRWALALCAAGAGLAAATKFVGFFIPPLMLWYLFTRKSTRKELACFALIACAAFALGAFILVTNLQYVGQEVRFALLRGANPEGDNAPLPIYKRPDWGTFFLTHGINWGLGWPLTVLAIWGIVRGIRSRREQPAAWLLVAATLLWYLSTEMTTLKRAPDTERYILPCIPMMAAVAAGVLMSLRWKYWPAVGVVLVCALGAESAAMTHSIRTDTRDLAARWLFEQTRGQPIKYLFPYSSGNYQINRALLPGYQNVPINYSYEMRYRLRALRNADVLTISHFSTDRFENFRRLSRNTVKDIKKMRKKFPYAKIFEKPWYARNGFHNPVIEIRFKQPFVEPAKK